ncbi:MAG: hypothetical protein IJ458_00795 [Clostridia bacterium]|nr:hypothetical protein [Clostridia bacterium]
MKINNFNYHFKMRSSKDIALNLGVIYKGLGYSKIDKNKISNIYNILDSDIEDENYLSKLLKKIEILHMKETDKINRMCEEMQKKWNEYGKEYKNIICNIFGITIDEDITEHTYCYLQTLPINEIDLNDNVIYLDCNKSIEEVFKKFIILLTKIILVNRWNSVNNLRFNTEFDISNKVFMFCEIAIDAIFENSKLCKISSNPSYEYLYSLKIKGQNSMMYFRQLYKQISLDKFFTEVYMFVHKNYQILLKFKKYLY